MKSQPSLRAEIDLDASGVVNIRLTGRRTGTRTIGLLLDDRMRGCIDLGARAARTVSWPLPVDQIFDKLDIVDAETGCSVMSAQVALAERYDIRVGDARRDGLVVYGTFLGAAFLQSSIPIELLADREVIARGVAVRPPGQAAFTFRMPITRLPELGRDEAAALRIGNAPHTHPLALDCSCSALGYAGRLDVAVPARVEGWALNLRHLDDPVQLEILVGTDVVGVTSATRSREDIRNLGFPVQGGGFTFDLPIPADPRAPKRVSVRIAGTLTALPGSPIMIDPLPDLAGRFDTLHGMSAHGWALDHAKPGEKVTVEAVGPTGEVLGKAVANGFRGDLLGAGLAGGLCAFKIDLSAHYERLIGKEILVRFAGTQAYLPGSPHRIQPNNNVQRFLRRREIFRKKPWLLPRLRRSLNHRAQEQGVSIIMPVHDTPRAWLSEALESVRHQFCDAWELICVDDASSLPHVSELLSSYARNDARVRVLTCSENVGVARATNFALRAARCSYVMFLDHDDYLEPDAVWQMIRASQMTNADLLYGDEALTDERLRGILELRLRPAFSYDYYLSHPYFVHPICVRTELARRLGGFDESLGISADVDFVLRVIEEAQQIAHVPAVLYRWRTHESSTGHARQNDVTAATLGALQRHLDRLAPGATASAGAWFNQYRIDWPAQSGRILIIIPTKNGAALLRRAVESIERTALDASYRLVVIDHESRDPETIDYLSTLADRHIIMPYRGDFNFSRMNNEAARRYGKDCDFILFLNNDIEATQPGWLDRMRSIAARADVGAVGALLMYPDQRVQHAGVVLGFNDSADHAHRLQDVFLDRNGRRNLGYNCALTSVREYSAVTAACLMMRREVFVKVGGFDVKFGIGFNDTDLCLRVQSHGFKVLYDGYTILYHYESATRSQTKQVFHPSDTRRMTRVWQQTLIDGDPFYNPNLSLSTQDHVPREDENCRVTYPPRVRANFLPVVSKN